MEQNSNETPTDTTNAAEPAVDAPAAPEAAAVPAEPVAAEPAAVAAAPEAAAAPKRTTRRATSKKVAADPAAAEAPAGEATVTEAAEVSEAAAEAPKTAPKRVSRARKKVAEPAEPAAETAADAAVETDSSASAVTEPAETAEPAPKKTTTRRRKTTVKAADDAVADTTEVATAAEAQAAETTAAEPAAVEPAAVEPATAEAPVEAPAAPQKRARRATSSTAKAAKAAEEAQVAETVAAEPVAAAAPEGEGAADAASNTEDSGTEAAEGERKKPATRTSRRSTSTRRGAKAEAEQADEAASAAAPAEAKTDAGDAEPTSDAAAGTEGEADQPQRAENGRADSGRSRSRSRGRSRGNADADATGEAAQNGAKTAERDEKGESDSAAEQKTDGQRHDRDDQQSSRSRTRQRDRKRRGQHNEDLIDPELTEEDVLLPIGGILDVLDNYAFVRTTGYLAGPSDVYVSLSQVKRYGLRKGDAIVGSIRKPSENDGAGRQKYNAIVKIDSVNGAAPAEDMQRSDFSALTAIAPNERLRLETTPEKVTQRVIDMIAPIGKGQRGIIAGPHRSGKSVVLQQIAHAVAENSPETHLMMVLVDERPEEVTELTRTIKGEVVASTFDRPAEDHTTVAELAIERAKRLVELGHDVVVLLDSITKLGRAYAHASQGSGRSHAPHLDASGLTQLKKLLATAVNVEHGGSLTILSTALIDTGSRAEEAVYEEIKGTSNMELRLSSSLAEKRVFPAVHLAASGTRREEQLLAPDEVKTTWMLRRSLPKFTEDEATELTLAKLHETSSNAEFLVLMQKSQGLS